MEQYKVISRKKVRFQTSRGPLTVEQLWSLPIDELDKLAVSLQEAYDESGKTKSFLTKRSVKDKDIKLQLDVVVDVLTTLAEELELAKTKAANKAHNAEIYSLIADKEKAKLAGKSIKQLESMIIEE